MDAAGRIHVAVHVSDDIGKKLEQLTEVVEPGSCEGNIGVVCRDVGHGILSFRLEEIAPRAMRPPSIAA